MLDPTTGESLPGCARCDEGYFLTGFKGIGLRDDEVPADEQYPRDSGAYPTTSDGTIGHFKFWLDTDQHNIFLNTIDVCARVLTAIDERQELPVPWDGIIARLDTRITIQKKYVGHFTMNSELSDPEAGNLQKHNGNANGMTTVYSGRQPSDSKEGVTAKLCDANNGEVTGLFRPGQGTTIESCYFCGKNCDTFMSPIVSNDCELLFFFSWF